ncbi:MAG: T9SS type B sorting domain-containing protein [Bacteroidota bacterium]
MTIFRKHYIRICRLYDIVIFRLHNGAIEWVQKISDESHLQRKVHVWMGNIYVAGQLDEGINTNIGLTVPAGFRSQYFIAQFDVFGNLKSSEQYGGNTNETFFDSQIDENGNIYFTGIVAPASYTSNISSYLNKVDSNLNLLWSQELSNNSPERPFLPLTLYYNNSNGKLYIWSKYYFNSNFYNNNASVSNGCEVGSVIMEVSKTTGDLENYKVIDNCGFIGSVGNGTGDVEQRSFMTHEGSNLYVLSSFRKEITIGNQTINTTKTIYDEYNSDLVLYKIDLTNFTPEIILRSEGESYYSTSIYFDLAGPIVALGNSIYITSSFMSLPITINGNSIVNNSGNNNRDILFYKHNLDQKSLKSIISYDNTCFSDPTKFSISGDFDSVLWNFNDPTSGANNTSNVNKPTHVFTNPGVYDVSVTVICGTETETVNLEVTISSPPSVNQINNLYSCEDTFGSQLSSSFNTTSLENDLIGNQSNLSIQYFDENGNEFSNPLPNPMSNTVLKRATITARVFYVNNPTCYTETSFDLIVESVPEIFPVNKIYECDDDDDGFTQFDLSDIAGSLIGSQPDLSLKLYDSDNNLIPENSLINYININSHQDFIIGRATNNTTTCYSETTISLVVNPVPVAYSVNPLIGCDDNNDGISEYFDLSGIEAEVLQGQTGMQVSYFRSDGSKVTELISPYTNLQPYEEILQVRVGNPETGCYAETSLTLKTSAAPALNTSVTLYSCDYGFGIGSFDTSAWNQNIIGNQTGLKVTYYSQSGNALPTPLPAFYSNAEPNTEKITIKVENELNSQCISESSFDLIVNKKEVLELEDSYNLCDLEPFLILKPTGEFDTWEWQDVSGAVISNTAEASLTAAGNYSVTVSKTENGVTCESSYAFRLIRSQLPAITEVKYQEWSSSNFIEIIAGGDGDLEYSIDGINFQDSNYFGNIPAGNYTVFARDRLGCGMASAEVILIDYPKYFTPNNDGFHDHWQIKGLASQAEIHVMIYDRFGKLLKEMSSLNQGWDGSFNGKIMPADDYWFSIALEDGKIFKGHFSLIR